MPSAFLENVPCVLKKLGERHVAIRTARAFQFPVRVPSPQTHDAASVRHQRVSRETQKRRLPFGISQDDDAVVLFVSLFHVGPRWFYQTRGHSLSLLVLFLELRSQAFC